MADRYPDVCKAITTRYEALKADRSSYLKLWSDTQKFILPDHGRGLSGGNSETEDKDGADKMTSIYDSTATAANGVLAAGLLNGLTNITRPWVHLGAQDPMLDERPEVKSWLYIVSERMRYVFSRSDLYTALHHSYSELGCFGTGPIAQLENFKKVMRFRPFTAGEYYLAIDHNGDVDTFYRDLWMTASQMIGQFGADNVSTQVMDAYKRNSETRFQVVQAIEPNDGRVPIPGPDWKWRSVYKEIGSNDHKLLSVGGHRRFPILAPRWFVVGNQVYGRACPGMVALPDVKQLQKETEKKLVALDKMVDPPTVSGGVPTEMQINTFPGGHTFDGSSPGGEGLRQLYQINMPVDMLRADINALQMQIKERFFNNLFLLLAENPGRMTAREVAERHSEKLELLGPSINRMTTELLQPLVENALDMMWQAGIIPPAPEELQGQELRVEFDSVLSQAQKMSGIGAIEQFVAFTGSVAGTRPDVMDKIDADELIDVYADRTGVPPSIVVSDEEVAKIRERRAQQAQLQQALQSGAVMAEAAKTLSQTDMGGNTALSTLQGALPGGLGGKPLTPGKQ
jgi:hypothetical protein